MPKHSFKKYISCTILPIAGRIRGFIPFPRGIYPNVNVIARLVFELAYYDSVVHRVDYYTTRTPPKKKRRLNIEDIILNCFYTCY